MPAEQAWSRRRQPAPVAGPTAGAAAGRAGPGQPDLSRSSPPGLRHARARRALDLDADGAYRFLSVVAPRCWTRPGSACCCRPGGTGARGSGSRLSAQHPDRRSGEPAGKFGRDQLVDFRWQLAVGDDTLTEDEIAALAETKAPLVRLRGQWVARRPRAAAPRAGVPASASRPSRKTAAEVLALAASHPDDLDTPLPVTACAAPTAGSATCSAGTAASR